jgi:phosphinothricin acetyltransferase
MHWIDCDHSHLEEIRTILNDAIVHSTALYDYHPRSVEVMLAWWTAKQTGGYPVIGATDSAGNLMGFASYGPFRAFPAYKYTVEHSVYIHSAHRGQGLGPLLLERLIERCEAQGFHTMIGVIDAENERSIALHEKLKFERCGEIRHAGFKFGRWLDLVFYQRLLSGPAEPTDG